MSRKAKDDARKPKQKGLRLKKETLKDLVPDSKAKEVRGGAASGPRNADGEIC